jgi:hypothetical protein
MLYRREVIALMKYKYTVWAERRGLKGDACICGNVKVYRTFVFEIFELLPSLGLHGKICSW